MRNKNAETHGAYSKVYFDELSEDEKILIESVTLDTGENTLRELQSLIAKEKDLEKRIKELNTDTTGNLYTDKVGGCRYYRICKERSKNRLGILKSTCLFCRLGEPRR